MLAQGVSEDTEPALVRSRSFVEQMALIEARKRRSLAERRDVECVAYLVDRLSDRCRGNCVPNAQPSQAIDLGEGTQNDDGPAMAKPVGDRIGVIVATHVVEIRLVDDR